MRTAIAVSLLIIAVVSGGVYASGRTPSSLETRTLALIPTAFEELNELRINTGEKAVLSDGTMNAVYVKKTPAAGNVYLNFHVDVSSAGGPVVLHSNQICLRGGVLPAATLRIAYVKGESASETPGTVSYTPMDWFLDTGAAEVRGESLEIKSKAIVQFTIEVPREGRDELNLFIGAQRVGTVKEIRERIAVERARG